MRVGIEKLRAYPGSLALRMADLCAARGREPGSIVDGMQIVERSLGVPWEDPVTMAVNAARPLLDARDRERIGLLLIASESGVDQEKPMSTWVQRHLELSSRVRNLEVKHACYGATGALQLAAAWVLANPGEAALIINTDESRAHFGKPWEYVMGCAAVAVLVSAQPRVLELELGACGVHTNEVSDLFRPTSRAECGHSETSLLSYLDALEAVFDDYIRRRPEAEDLDAYFQRIVYHLPFAGMGVVAHRALLRRSGIARAQANAHFAGKAGASTRFAKRLGGTYGASTFLGLMALLDGDEAIEQGDRVGIFSYGSGSCAELWSGRVLPEAREVVRAAGLAAQLDARRVVTVDEYEAVERARDAAIDASDHPTDQKLLGDWYAQRYAHERHLVFDGTKEYVRQYRWSA